MIYLLLWQGMFRENGRRLFLKSSFRCDFIIFCLRAATCHSCQIFSVQTTSFQALVSQSPFWAAPSSLGLLPNVNVVCVLEQNPSRRCNGIKRFTCKSLAVHTQIGEQGGCLSVGMFVLPKGTRAARSPHAGPSPSSPFLSPSWCWQASFFVLSRFSFGSELCCAVKSASAVNCWYSPCP